MMATRRSAARAAPARAAGSGNSSASIPSSGNGAGVSSEPVESTNIRAPLSNSFGAWFGVCRLKYYPCAQALLQKNKQNKEPADIESAEEKVVSRSELDFLVAGQLHSSMC